MSVTVSKKAIVDLLKETMIGTGLSDEERPAPISVTELPVSDLPIEASNEPPSDGVFELPPVEDEEYRPHNSAALSRAAFAIAKSIPPKQINKFYKKLQDLAQDTVARQEQEDIGMNVHESKLRARIRQLIREATEEDDLKQRADAMRRLARIKARATSGADIEGMLADLEEVEPSLEPGDPGYEEYQAELDQLTKIAKGRAAASLAKKDTSGWGDVQFKKKKKETEFFDQPGYRAEPVEEPGGYGHPMTLDQIAGEVEGLNTPSAVRQFLEDPRKINLMDKIQFLLQMPEEARKKVMIGAAADYITQMEDGKLKEPLDHTDPVVKAAVKHYVSDLQEKGALDPEDADTMLKRAEYVVELGSFKEYAVDYFDNNFDELIKYAPFREHLKKFWAKLMRDDPNLKQSVEKRRIRDIERVQMKKAAKKAGK